MGLSGSGAYMEAAFPPKGKMGNRKLRDTFYIWDKNHKVSNAGFQNVRCS